MTHPHEATPVGLLLVDKPGGVTSHDVVGRVRAIASTRRVGHAGTLDPMATGLLIVAIGRATKLLSHVVSATKSYTATIRLGESTDTDDAEGQVIASTHARGLSTADISAAMDALTGPINQVPSTYSAIKVGGRRAYARARAGEEVTLDARRVTVDRFEALGPPRIGTATVDIDVAVDCSTGTYVRALARDLGEALEVGAHLSALRRVRIGPFAVNHALDVFPNGVGPRDAPRPPIDEHFRREVLERVIPVSDAIHTLLPSRTVDAHLAKELRYGRSIAAIGQAGVYAAFDADGSLLALLRESDGRAKPTLVWQAAG